MMVQVFFERRKIIFEKLIPYGFVKKTRMYEYNTPILDGDFQMYVMISEEGRIETKVIDVSLGEEFVLHLVAGTEGSFIGKVKQEYEDVLASIRENCTEKEVFKSQEAKKSYYMSVKNMMMNLNTCGRSFLIMPSGGERTAANGTLHYLRFRDGSWGLTRMSWLKSLICASDRRKFPI
mgnify:CR=1 FL=1